jgi:hypothetical protein
VPLPPNLAIPVANPNPKVVPVPSSDTWNNVSSNATTPKTLPSGLGAPNQVTPATGTQDDVLQSLYQRGVSQPARVDRVPEGVRLICLLPMASDSSQVLTLRATAADLPTAVREIVQQIERQR